MFIKKLCQVLLSHVYYFILEGADVLLQNILVKLHCPFNFFTISSLVYKASLMFESVNVHLGESILKPDN